MPTFEIMMVYFHPNPKHLKFHHDQTNCKWVDAYSIRSSVTMEYDTIENIHSLNLLNAKNLDEFVEQIIVVRIVVLLIKFEHMPLVENIVGHLVLCIRLCWIFASCCRFIMFCFCTHNSDVRAIYFSIFRICFHGFEGNHTKLQECRH